MPDKDETKIFDDYAEIHQALNALPDDGRDDHGVKFYDRNN